MNDYSTLVILNCRKKIIAILKLFRPFMTFQCDVTAVENFTTILWDSLFRELQTKRHFIDEILPSFSYLLNSK